MTESGFQDSGHHKIKEKHPLGMKKRKMSPGQPKLTAVV